MKEQNKKILSLAVPSIVSNITVPLLGLVDLAIVGHIGDDRMIGAVAIGSMIFNVMYWLMAFLRMGTGGMTAQAFGSRKGDEMVAVLVRSLAVGLSLAFVIVAAQKPLGWLLMWLMSTPQASLQMVADYFDIVVWGAPAMLGLYCLNGWFVGMQDTRVPMVVAIIQNVVNIIASLALVFAAGMQIEGVAGGTLIAQWTGFILALLMAHLKLKKRRLTAALRGVEHIFTVEAMKRFFSVNRDIFLRTVCLVAVNFFFTSQGARQGTMMLAVNTLLITMYTIFSYFMDGFAYAAEALAGRYLGARDDAAFRELLHHLFVWGVAMVAVFTLAYVVGGRGILMLLTNDSSIVEAAAAYQPWTWLIPVCGVAAFLYDGIFVGLTASRGMLASTASAMIVFFAFFFALDGIVGNHALWMAFLAFLATRGMVEALILRRKLKHKQKTDE